MAQKIRLPEYNNVVLIGRVIRDPDLRYTQKGQAVCRFDVAVNRNYKDSNGEWQKEVCYVPIVVWRDAAIRCSERLKKGSPVHISGRLRTRSYEDKNGQKRNVLEVEAQRIQFLEIVEEAPEAAEIPEATAQTEEAPENESEEDIPF